MNIAALRTETVSLSQPVLVHDEEVSEFVFREPTGRDMVAGGKAADYEWDLRVVASCCGVPPSTIMNMVARDVIKLLGVYADFFGTDDGRHILDRYFEAGYLWGDIDYILGLTPGALSLHLDQIGRIRKKASKAHG